MFSEGDGRNIQADERGRFDDGEVSVAKGKEKAARDSEPAAELKGFVGHCRIAYINNDSHDNIWDVDSKEYLTGQVMFSCIDLTAAHQVLSNLMLRWVCLAVP